MMSEMAGVLSGTPPLSGDQKATTARINFAEVNAKIDLYMAIVGETFVRDFYTLLAYLETRFETNKTVLRIANNKLMQEWKIPIDELGRFLLDGLNFSDLTNFEADVIINVGAGTVGRDLEVKQISLAMDRAIMANQAAASLAQVGAIPEDGLKFIDITKFYETLLPKIGIRNAADFIITVQPPQQEGQDQAAAGAATPQIGGEISELEGLIGTT
jgi:hypothetical protein